MEFIQINENDNVLIALKDVPRGHIIPVHGKEIPLKEDIKRGHNVAIKPIKLNEDIIKYCSPIGHATQPVLIGEHVHTHNTKTNLDGLLEYNFDQKLVDNPYEKEDLTFEGFRRKNGEVGIRNELWVIPTVGCVNGVAETIIKRFINEIGHIHPFENVLV